MLIIVFVAGNEGIMTNPKSTVVHIHCRAKVPKHITNVRQFLFEEEKKNKIIEIKNHNTTVVIRAFPTRRNLRQ